MSFAQPLRAALGSAYRARLRHLPLSAFERAWGRVETYTMLGPRRLARLWKSAQSVVREGIPGDVVECGVARGGSAALLAMSLEHAGARDRVLRLYDSFEGMPAPSPVMDADHERASEFIGLCRGSEDEVRGLLAQVAPRTPVEITAGRYEQTLPGVTGGPVALLHVDCDWYESVMATLRAFYDRVSAGGIIQLDDYHTWQGCRRAVDEFFTGPRATTFHRIDGTAVWCRKARGAAEKNPASASTPPLAR